MHFYGLLYIDGNDAPSINLKNSSFSARLTTYVQCAKTLARTLTSGGDHFTLLTNNHSLVSEISDEIGIRVVEIPFTTVIPQGIPFYSAHFKLDVFKYLSHSDDEYSVFCDLDVLALNATPDALTRAAIGGLPLVYDITSQVGPVYGAHQLLRTLNAVEGVPDESYAWYGGEYLSGSPSFFSALYSNCISMLPRYIDNLALLHHIGDEAIVSSAIRRMRRHGTEIADAGQLGIVARYWNYPVRHKQTPLTKLAHCMLLHLPSDKRFIANLSDQSINSREEVRLRYLRYNRSPRNRLLYLAKAARNALSRRAKDE